MQFAAHVVDVMHARNPLVTDRIPDSAGLGRAIHSVEFFESLAIFHVDRRRCGPATLFEAGMPVPGPAHERSTWRAAVIDVFESMPAWARPVFQPIRRGLGIAERAAARRVRARRVRQYFR